MIKYEGSVRKIYQAGRELVIFFHNDQEPDNAAAIFADFGTISTGLFGSLALHCPSKRAAASAAAYARKIDTWDTNEVINWAQNDKSVYLECDRLALKYRDRPIRAQVMIASAIRNSGILDGHGVRLRLVDWRGVAACFLDSLPPVAPVPVPEVSAAPVLADLPQDMSAYTDAQTEAVIAFLAALPLSELRARQDLTRSQLKTAARLPQSETITRGIVNLQIMEDQLMQAVDRQTFGPAEV